MTGSTTVVVGGHVFEVLADSSTAPKSMTVTIRAEGEREWTFDEPGWRPLGYGLGVRGFYLWSARRVISFAGASKREPDVIPLDEDILAAFQVGETWLVACETSVRLLGEPGELSRIELSEVASHVRLDGRTLSVVNRDGAEVKVDISPTKLSVVD